MILQYRCPICHANAFPLDVVDFNKSCENGRGQYLPLVGIPIYYFLCENCSFCFAPEMYQWSLADFKNKIYNADYIKVDPDYLEMRPQMNAKNLMDLFGQHKKTIRHLDYGGGDGLLSQLLCKQQWQSVSYDPFYEKKKPFYAKSKRLADLGTFDLITAYEVFEHVSDVNQLMANLALLLNPNGIILFSTLLSDGNITKNQRIHWWYAAPRNGHISLFSKMSLSILAHRSDFTLGSFSEAYHVFWKTVPSWAAHIIKTH